MKDTSLEVYYRLKEEGIIGKREMVVLEALTELPESTDQELKEHIGEEDPNYVRPRRRTLVRLGVVVEAGKRKCRVTRNKAYTWILNHEIDFEQVKKNKEKIKNKTLTRALPERREIISETFMEALVKAMNYVEEHGIEKSGMKLKYAERIQKPHWKKELYKVIITREK